MIRSNTPARRQRTKALAIPTQRVIRDKEHLRSVAAQPCLVCGRQPAQAHHLRFMQPRAMGRKGSDEWTVPLCAIHHRQLHDAGDERRWWAERQIEPAKTAEVLWAESKHLPGITRRVCRGIVIHCADPSGQR